MILNCYYYAPHNHTLLSEHIETDLVRMAEMGTDVVTFCVQESQITNWHQQRIRNMVDRIHAHGMKAHAIPNRWAGLVAGWLDGFGLFTLENIDTLIRDTEGNMVITGAAQSCIQHPKVAEHIRSSLTQLFETFNFDGLIWDEPHSRACYCEKCTSLNPTADPLWPHRQCADFLDEMSAYAKSLREDLVVSVFAQPDQDELLDALLDTRHIEFVGSDGHVRSPDHQMHRMKGTIHEAYEKFMPRIRAAGKKSFFLLEAQRHRDADLENYLQNLEKAFSYPMDHLMYYYSAHEMSSENESIFNRETWAMVKSLKGL